MGSFLVVKEMKNWWKVILVISLPAQHLVNLSSQWAHHSRRCSLQCCILSQTQILQQGTRNQEDFSWNAVCLPATLRTWMWSVCHLSVCLHVCCLSVHPFFGFSLSAVCLSIRLSFCLSVFIYVCLSVGLSLAIHPTSHVTDCLSLSSPSVSLSVVCWSALLPITARI